MLKTLLGLSLFITSIALHAAVNNLSNAEVKQMIAQGVPIIDVRRPDEWKQTGVIKGSHLMTFFDKKGRYNMDKWLSEFNKVADPDKPFILICRSGSRTGQISHFLDEKLGFLKVSHVKNGINRWISAGEPTVSAASVQ